MCVIIIIPKGETIEKTELLKAWNTNPDGAGYATRTTDPKTGELKVLFHRGFMNFPAFYDEIKNKIGREDIILHFRISTSTRVNKTETHPYKKGDIFRLKGLTNRPVICMNGTIPYSQYITRFNCNDTMSYIKDNGEVFKIIAETGSNKVLNLIQEATGARWAMITPDKTLFSSDFVEYKGKYYSNKNHLKPPVIYTKYYNYTGATKTGKKQKTAGEKPTPAEILAPGIYAEIKNNHNLYIDLLDYIETATPEETEALQYITDPQELNYILYWSRYY